MMTDDVRLSKMIDKELASEERAEMEALLENDAAAKTRLNELEKNDNLVRAALSGPMEEEVPDRFLAAIDKGLAKDQARGQDNSPTFNSTKNLASNDNTKGWWRMGGAVAASLAIGLFFGSQLMTDSSAPSAMALNNALSTLPSMQTAVLASGESVTPQLSFAQTGGGYCRQFSISGKKGAKTGVACRGDGEWTIEALVPGTAPSAQDGYVAAEGPTNLAIDSVIATLRAGDPLDSATEAELIAQVWE